MIVFVSTSMMSNPYSSALDVIRQLQEMGAVRVRVGEVEAEFRSSARTLVDPFDAPSEEDLLAMEKEANARWAEEQYWSAS